MQVQPNILSLEIDSQQLVSSDINIIETSGCNIKIKLHGRIGRVENKNDLFREILIIWTAITPQYVQSLYRSIPKILQHMIRLKGQCTR